MAAKDFDYRDKTAPKLSEDFKQIFSTNIKGKNAIKAEGLTAVAHMKGMWKCETKIIQYPNDQNNWTCICQATIGGYDWDPSEQKIVKVEYTDIGDANVNNVTGMVKASYIRMAATRAVARAMRKYTNIDMVSTDELDNVVEETMITIDQLNSIRMGIKQHNITQQIFGDIMIKCFGHTNFQALTEAQGERLLQIVNNYVASQQQQSQPKANNNIQKKDESNTSEDESFSADSLNEGSDEENPF
jgi:hypothetical protein